MQPSQHPEFCKMIYSLAELYGQKKPSDFVIALWWNALKNFDISVVRQALSAHVTNPDNGQFMPKPADVVRLLGGTTQDRALVAWSRVAEAVRRVGNWESVVFDDHIIHAVIYEMGGWVALGSKTDKEWDFVKNEFVTRYRSYSHGDQTPNYPPVLVGMFETQNRMNGFKSQLPRLIGDKEAARNVMANGSLQLLEISPSESTFQRISFGEA